MLDLACLTSGSAFSNVIYDENGKIQKINWDRARNMNSFKTALPTNTAEVVRNWNMTVKHLNSHEIFLDSHRICLIVGS